MADLKASVSFTADGTTKKYYFNFDYINPEYIKVNVGGTELSYPSDYSVIDRSVELKVVPAKDTLIRIYRQTPSNRIIEWADGSFIKASQMTLGDLQQLHLIEEAQDYPILNGISTYPDGENFNAVGRRIINVADPVNPQDAVTKNYMESVQDGFVQRNTAIENNIKAMQSDVTTKNQQAQQAKDMAQKWAESDTSPDGQPDDKSDTGLTQSAKGWAQQARDSAREFQDFSGATEETDGIRGLVPQPTKGGIRVLKSDGSWGDYASLPIGFTRWIYNKGEKLDNEVYALGTELSRTAYSVLWNWAQKNGLVKSESEWQEIYNANDKKFVPWYSDGDGSTTFRCPLLGIYPCGVTAENDIGVYLHEGLPNITGTVDRGGIGYYGVPFTSSGAFKKSGALNGTAMPGGEMINSYVEEFDAHDSNPIYGNSEHVNPMTMLGCYVITAYGQAVDTGNQDISQLMAALTALSTKLQEVQNELAEAQDNFTIIYPNDGSADSPANIAINSRYVDDNPFPGYYVHCEAQIYFEGKWGAAGWVYSDGGWGTAANQLLPDDKIVTQTGRQAVWNGISNNDGSPFNHSSNIKTALPCRVLVYRMGKIQDEDNAPISTQTLDTRMMQVSSISSTYESELNSLKNDYVTAMTNGDVDTANEIQNSYKEVSKEYTDKLGGVMSDDESATATNSEESL